MQKYVLFIQGAGAGAYAEDRLLRNDLSEVAADIRKASDQHTSPS
jgi:hypothetical protein